MRRIEPVQRINQTENDLYKDVRCTIQADAASRRPDAPKMTMERAIEHAQQFDPSFVVDLGKKDIPSFLYDNKGIIK